MAEGGEVPVVITSCTYIHHGLHIYSSRAAYVYITSCICIHHSSSDPSYVFITTLHMYSSQLIGSFEDDDFFGGKRKPKFAPKEVAYKVTPERSGSVTEVELKYSRGASV